LTWIRTIGEEEAVGLLADVYALAREDFSFVPDAVKVFSLRPDVAAAQTQLRRTLLGNASTLGARRADMIGAAVSGLNRCEYCGAAHAGLLAKREELSDEDAVTIFRNWRVLDLPEQEQAMLAFAEKLTLMPSDVCEEDIERLRAVGFSEENIYDIVLLTAYRNFMNRVNDGLGVPTDRLRQRFGDSLVDAVASRAAPPT
jgi:uncharacterized peroxidase-related enzyme